MPLNIYIASTRELPFVISDPAYKVIQVGAFPGCRRFAAFADDTGDNIASKNQFYCELTALYWMWKNRKCDNILGLCHYRRYFFLQGAPKLLAKKVTYDINEMQDNLSTKDVPAILEHYDIIAPVKVFFDCSVETQYKNCQRANDFVVMKDVVSKLYPEYGKVMNKVFLGRGLYPYNMFISKKIIFDQYMQWLFNILLEIEKHITIPYGDIDQRRVFGYLAERLFSLYVEYNKLKVKEVPIIYLADKKELVGDEYQHLRYFFRKYLV